MRLERQDKEKVRGLFTKMRTLRSLTFFQNRTNVQCKENRQNTMNLRE